MSGKKTTQSQKIKNILKDLPDNLEDMSKEKLVKKLKEIQECVKVSRFKMKKGKTEFDFKKYKRRHIALRILYLGWDCDGFVVQDNTDETIEAHLFEALKMTKIIENRETSNYHRCGRTDKGVSAFFQVISIDVRSNVLEGQGVFTPEDYIPNAGKVREQESDYVGILNSVLPLNIRAISWAAVDKDFSARFSCMQREYKYWFPRANLNINRMVTAATYLIGEHDFRNFCKLDVKNNVTNCIRRITSTSIGPVGSSADDGPYQMMEFTIKATAFLWHQIRCIITVLLLVGMEKEEPEVVKQMLDIERCPQKPQYNMACEIPLALYDCQFEGVNWIYGKENLTIVIKQLQDAWMKQSAKTTMLVRMVKDLEMLCGSESRTFNQADSLLVGVRPRVYKPLLQRNVCESLEQKIANKKRKDDRKESSEKIKRLKNGDV